MIKLAMLASASCIAYAAGSGDHPETVQVKIGNETFTINRDDHDEKKHGKILTGRDDDEAPPQPAIASAPAPGIIVPPPPSAPSFIDPATPQTVNDDTLALDTKGTGAKKRFIVVFAKDASPVTGWRDIDEEGYKTETEAWAAIMTAKKQPYEQQIEPPANMPTADDIEAAKDAADGKAE